MNNTPYILCAVAVLLTGCSKQNTFVQPPPPQVTVQNPMQKDVTIYRSFPCRTEAAQTIEIRARVAGFLRSVEFTPGDLVKKDQVLFRIEPDQYEATLETARSQLTQAEASQKLAKTTLERKTKAFKTQAISELDLLSSQAELDSAIAAVRAAKAAVEQAELNLSYTEIKAPSAGRIGRDMVNIGNLVGAGGQATLLTTLVVQNPAYVYAELDERSFLPFLRKTYIEKKDPPKVKLTLADGVEYSETGLPDYIDPQLDPDTGTVTVRAVFENPDELLRPGMFARLLVPRELKDAILIPELSLQRDMVGTYVFVVDDKNLVEQRYIELGANAGDGQRQVVKGLTTDDQVIIAGFQRARPGAPVQAQPAKPAAADSAQ